jgi:hypothetical protein
VSSDLRARILNRKAQKGPADTLEVPEWGEKVGVRRLSLRERLNFEKENGTLDSIDRKQDPEGYSRWLVRYCLVTATDLQGERLFHPEDEKTLEDASATSIERVVLKAMKVNVVTADEVRELGNASSEVRNGASPSASQAISD